MFSYQKRGKKYHIMKNDNLIDGIWNLNDRKLARWLLPIYFRFAANWKILIKPQNVINYEIIIKLIYQKKNTHTIYILLLSKVIWWIHWLISTLVLWNNVVVLHSGFDSMWSSIYPLVM